VILTKKSAVALLMPAHTLLFVCISAPSLYVFWLSLHQSTYGTSLSWVGLDNFVALFRDAYFWRATWQTFIIVNVIVYVEILLAIVLSYLFYNVRRGKALILAALLAPYAVSEVVGVLVWRIALDPSIGPLGSLLSSWGLSTNWSASPVTAFAVVCIIAIWHHLPFSFLLTYAGLLAVPKDLHEAGRIDGASEAQIFFRISIPLIVPAILISILFRLVFSFRIFSEVWLLTRGGPARLTEVLSIYLYELGFQFGDFGKAAAAGWMLVVGTLLVASFYLRSMYVRMVREHGR
jgi:multiple sugar transport system permease protein